jgi:hypothetical protein
MRPGSYNEKKAKVIIAENPDYSDQDWEAEKREERLLIDGQLVEFHYVSVGPAVQGKEIHKIDFFLGIGSFLCEFGGSENTRDITATDAANEDVILITKESAVDFVESSMKTDSQTLMRVFLETAQASEWPNSLWKSLFFRPKPQVKETLWVWTKVTSVDRVSERIIQMSGECQTYL